MTPAPYRPVESSADHAPLLDANTRERLGRQLRALYDPVVDEPIDPRLAELLSQLDRDKDAAGP
ncbi:NepR family anti-sigma factor [Methylobacterium sp. A54F]